jgi:glycosyltransferase involved in cell wall biosynthesis
MNPAVSVITVCRNDRERLLRTRASLESQTPAAHEWIIVDGASTDGTAEILRELDPEECRWISEPDTGIYDAMNKGLAMATGHRVWFMNAGDVFHDEQSLAAVAAADPATEICYGEAVVEDAAGKELGKRSEVTPHALPDPLTKGGFRMGMVVSHQAFIPRREIAPMYLSDKYKFSADLDWMLQILSEERSSTRLGTLARVIREGATMENWRRSQWERFLILARHFGYPVTAWNHLRIAVRRLRHGSSKGLWR